MKDHLSRDISVELIQECQEINIKNLQTIITKFESTERKLSKLFVLILFVCAIALYWLFFNLLGGDLGFIVFIALIGTIIFCTDKLGISFKNKPKNDGRLAYEVCLTLEALVGLKRGTYSPLGDNISVIGTGKHKELYHIFTQLYPEFTNKKLEKLASIEITNSDIFD